MQTASSLLASVDSGALDERLVSLYALDGAPDSLARARARAAHVIRSFIDAFGDTPAALFSGPGRTEIGGNHTDHQHGRVLCASVDLDMLACAAPNALNVARVISEGYPALEISLDDLSPREEEKNTSAALVRGVAAKVRELGHPLSGFDAYVTSNVLSGSGLSSSAAYEVLMGNILNHFCCGDALDPVAIAKIGQQAENVYFGKPCGLMDQMASSVGGVISIDFADPAHPVIEKVDFDLNAAGHALCIIDSGADHADLTDEYAAVPNELKEICTHFGKAFLRDVPNDHFFAALPQLREEYGDRAVLRAIHVYRENARVASQVAALREGDFGFFLNLVNQSGLSSWRYLQNIVPAGSIRHQEMAVALALAEQTLDTAGACRVHGGGFAGTIQAFVPVELVDHFKAVMDGYLGQGKCHILHIRLVGGCLVAE